jgi:hypothetical protein
MSLLDRIKDTVAKVSASGAQKEQVPLPNASGGIGIHYGGDDVRYYELRILDGAY